MKKVFLMGTIALMISGATMTAQVGVNTETPKATLDVVASKTDGSTAEGLIAPRLSGDQMKAGDAMYNAAQNGTLVYATAASSDAGVTGKKTINVSKPGYYYYDAPNNVWVAVGAGNSQWFYMPSFNLPITATGPATFNLYNEYVAQFTGLPNSASPTGELKKSTGAAGLPIPYSANQLEFYVTEYTPSVLKVDTISAAGVMSYTVLQTNVPDGSFINVIFKVK